MKILVTIASILCAAMLWGDALPTNEEINQTFQTATGYEQINGQLHTALTNTKYSTEFLDSEIARVRLCIMTNAFCRRVATNAPAVMVNEFSAKRRLLGWVFSAKAVKNDINALNYCADYINTIRPISTNDFASEYAQYHAATNMQAFWMKWKPIQHYNFRIPMYRFSVLEEFWYPIAHYQKSLPEAEIPAFRSNIVMRAGLSQEVAEKLFDPEDWFFKPVPSPQE